ncbi:VCL1 protein [Nymphaea thermarum]|nr:VCL1 protein [Nymphaea thermarum]
MAEAVSVAAEWQLLHNRYYRKPELYSMCWQRMDLGRHRVACARFGGPTAAIGDDSKIVQLFEQFKNYCRYVDCKIGFQL